MLRKLGLLAVLLMCAASSVAQQRSGLDLSSIDPGVRPQDDLWRFANGKWLARTEIPADRAGWDTFTALRDATQGQLRDLLEGIDASADGERRKLADFYASFMDENQMRFYEHPRYWEDPPLVDFRGVLPLSGVGIPGMRRSRATIAAFAVGWVLIAGGTAGAVVAFGRGPSSQSTNSAAVAPTPSQTSSSPTPTATPTPSPSSSSSPSPNLTTPIPSPSSTVTGKVANGLHSGDIRYFLLPVPADGSVVGTPDGDPLTAAQVSQLYSNSADVLKSLQRLNFKDGATRHYQTADGKYHVWSRILHFADADAARAWALGDKPKPEWTEFSIPGYPDEKGYDISSVDATTGEARLRAVGFRGDVFFEVDVFGEPPVDHTVLIDRVRKQIARLDSGS